MIHHTLHTLSHRLRAVAMTNTISSHKRKRAIRRFTEKVGFVYFGTVDQHHDDHQIIRGLTVSSSHRDNNYCVGSFDGYDVSVVDRLDTIESGDGSCRTHNWMIVAITLQTVRDMPHVFVGAASQTASAYAKLFTAFASLQPVPLGTFESYPEEFTRRYSLFTAPTHFIEIERFFAANTTRVLAAHFWPLSIEVIDGVLYVYADSTVITMQLLETMLKNGLWLAEQIDQTP